MVYDCTLLSPSIGIDSHVVRFTGVHSRSKSSGVSSRTRSLKAASVQNSGDPGRCFPSSAHMGRAKERF